MSVIQLIIDRELQPQLTKLTNAAGSGNPLDQKRTIIVLVDFSVNFQFYNAECFVLLIPLLYRVYYV